MSWGMGMCVEYNYDCMEYYDCIIHTQSPHPRITPNS